MAVTLSLSHVVPIFATDILDIMGIIVQTSQQSIRRYDGFVSR